LLPFSKSQLEAPTLGTALVSSLLSWFLSLCLQLRVVDYFRFRFYQQDTLFHLSLNVQVGLVLLCVVVIAGFLAIVFYTSWRWASRFVGQSIPTLAMGFLANLVFVVAVLISVAALMPQLLYEYYQLQWVIDWPNVEVISAALSRQRIETLNQAITVLTVTSTLVLICIVWVWQCLGSSVEAEE